MIEFLNTFNDTVIYQEEKINDDLIIKENLDFIISYGYRFILSKRIVNYYLNKIINLHISYLPWNRGADPNLWSFLDDTPKGVTIHYIDEGLDTGDIIAQKNIEFLGNETLSTSYLKLTLEIESLFKYIWPSIRLRQNNRITQNDNGSYHHSKEKDKYMHLLVNGWETCIKDIVGAAK